MRLHVLGCGHRLFSSRRSSYRFALLPAALEAFHRQHDHFVVPFTFQVPQNDPFETRDSLLWPEGTRGMQLGREVRQFVRVLGRDHDTPTLQRVRQQLDAIKFPVVGDWRRFQWEQRTISALTRYKEMEGHLVVPRTFKVPRGDLQWPRATWGLNLGMRVTSLRQHREKLRAYQIQDLDDIEFVWVIADYTWDVLFMPALRHYRQLYGHCDVPQNYVVGSSDRKEDSESWPKRLRGYRLGQSVNCIRSRSAFAAFLERDKLELQQLGFYPTTNDCKWAETILPTLKTYHRVYGNCKIDPYFIVPEEEPWPPSAWNLRLGFTARNIRSRGDYFVQVAQDFKALEEIGFVWNMVAVKWEFTVLPALHTYVQEYGHCKIPASFVVPCNDPWPMKSHGFKLGQFATKPARRERYADFIEIDRMPLEALGFFWSITSDDASSGLPSTVPHITIS
ncbi:unnamed protein product [Hyaloperonospora brassicae]|uniref:Helicase-associated domain-containing protein n=1 Tax=Hyaloperonospora brassicae TaxID=162125 RepID=A0AAV0T6D2_HYABA|nr:unnamed protein product [Hyaloperonospora brassicae]